MKANSYQMSIGWSAEDAIKFWIKTAKEDGQGIPCQRGVKLLNHKRTLLFVCFLGLLVTSCDKESSSHIQVSALQLPRPNPTSYSFPYPLRELQIRISQAFSMDHQMDKPIFGKPTMAFDSILAVETATNAIFSETVFQDPANTNDFYLHSFHEPIVVSPVYHEQGTSLPFIAVFQLHLVASNSNETTISVITSHTEVVDGQKFGIGPCGPGMANRYEPVPPTTIEEYTLLHYIGDYLGMTNMPPIILPKP